MDFISFPRSAKHLPDTSVFCRTTGTLQTKTQILSESMATGHTQRCIFTCMSEPPLWPLLAVTTLATGTEGRLPSAYRGQKPAPNHVLLHFEDSIPFLLP